jgi:hypothetical protein
VDAADIAAALSALPMHGFDDLAVGSSSLPPREQGFYAWWQSPGALPAVTATPHPSAGLELLYVGIAPGRPGSPQNLRRRLAKHHRGAIGSSTLRFSLTAFLWRRERWQPTMASRAQLAGAADAALHDWQREHLSVQWVPVPSPWVLEAAVIALMGPPLNRAHNHGHPAFPAVGLARDALREEASARPVPFGKRRQNGQ